ncbi:MAG: hypothetical protein WC969_01865 [Elusimicrobiota bacterium]|jgi:hypothetical protein
MMNAFFVIVVLASFSSAPARAQTREERAFVFVGQARALRVADNSMSMAKEWRRLEDERRAKLERWLKDAQKEREERIHQGQEEELEKERQIRVRTGGWAPCYSGWPAESTLGLQASLLCAGASADEWTAGSSGSEATTCVLDPALYPDAVVERLAVRRSGCAATLLRDLFGWMMTPPPARPSPAEIDERVRALREARGLSDAVPPKPSGKGPTPR